MQVFVTDPSPYISAQRLWNYKRRALKMITETQQILACCQQHFFGEVTMLKMDGTPFKTPLSRMNHPVVKWACESKANMKWLLEHLKELFRHYDGDKFTNVGNNWNIVFNQIFNEKYKEHTPFLNFAKADSKKLNYTHYNDVYEAYDEFLKVQGA